CSNAMVGFALRNVSMAPSITSTSAPSTSISRNSEAILRHVVIESFRCHRQGLGLDFPRVCLLREPAARLEYRVEYVYEWPLAVDVRERPLAYVDAREPLLEFGTQTWKRFVGNVMAVRRDLLHLIQEDAEICTGIETIRITLQPELQHQRQVVVVN